MHDSKRTKKVMKSILINVYEYEGVVDEVTTGGFLGVIPMEQQDVPGPVYAGQGTFRGKQYPVSVAINSLGTVPARIEYRGDSEVITDEQVNALAVIDRDRLDKLTPEERATLLSIGMVKLHTYVTEAINATPRVWTPFVDACQDADQKLGLPQYHTEPIYKPVEGKKAIGCDVRVNINGAQFVFGEGGFEHCTDGRKLYQFWTDAAIGVFPDGEVYYPGK